MVVSDRCLIFFQVTKAYNYIHKYGHKSKLMVASIRNKQDVFNILGYILFSYPFNISMYILLCVLLLWDPTDN